MPLQSLRHIPVLNSTKQEINKGKVKVKEGKFLIIQTSYKKYNIYANIRKDDIHYYETFQYYQINCLPTISQEIINSLLIHFY